MEKKCFVIAVSGGPDSMALLDMLYQENKAKLVVCTVNYMTRTESDKDCLIVENYCRERGIIFHSKVVDYYQKGNFQKFARDERYKFFKEIYDQYNASGLYVAHHLDDVLETYYFQKIRNQFVRFYGIAPSSRINGMLVLRPLLDLFKDDLLDYCHENNIEYGIDCSNLKPVYTRNQIRLGILADKSKEEKFTLLQKMQDDQRYLENINEEVKKLVHPDVSLMELRKRDLNTQVALIRYLIDKECSGKGYLFSVKKIKDILSQLFSIRPNIIFDLSDDKYLVKSYDILKVVRSAQLFDYEVQIDNQDIELRHQFFKVRHQGEEKEEIIASSEDYPLTIRNYRDGDKIMTKNGHKSLRRFFIDKKIDKASRHIYPLVVNCKGIIILIPGLYQNYLNNNLQTSQFVVKLFSDTTYLNRTEENP